jgi:Damage-control phosphatase ARMT1-like domain
MQHAPPAAPAPPRPIRTDGSNAFAHYSMRERVPRIARDMLERNQDYPAAILGSVERLARDIEDDRPLPEPQPPDGDVPGWTAAHASHAGETWLGTDWFFAEVAFYREIVRLTRFWETGRDPFAPIKDEELSGDRPWSRLEEALAATGGPRDRHIVALLDASLWGNRVDLSYAVGAAREGRHDDDLLVDERDRALPFLVSPAVRLHIIADNTGTELALDLALVDAVLADPAASVTVHLKMAPTFVSDAMPADVWRLVDRMGARPGVLRALARRVESCFAEGRLKLAPDPFWNGPRFLWDAPAHLRASLASASVVVAKGDANYRRIIGDALWPPATPTAIPFRYLPTPTVCLRTLKSDAVVGLPPGLAERLDAVSPRWRIDAQRGVIQTYVPPMPLS